MPDLIVGDRPLLDHLLMHLGAFGLRHAVLAHGPEQRNLCDRIGGAQRWGISVSARPVANDAKLDEIVQEIGAVAVDRLLVCHPTPLLCDIARFLAAPWAPTTASRLLVHGSLAAPAGMLLLGRNGTDRAGTERFVAADPAHDLCVAAVAPARPAAFLDRDGVLNVDEGYTYRHDRLSLTPTAAEGVRMLNAAGYRVIVVTNQSGVARGLYGTADVEHFHDALQARMLAAGAHIDAFYYCPYHPDGTVPAFTCDHPDRKPRPGMLLRGMAEWAIERGGSFMIGDRQSDLDAAAGAGIVGFLVPKNRCDLAAEVRAILHSQAISSEKRVF